MQRPSVERARRRGRAATVAGAAALACAGVLAALPPAPARAAEFSQESTFAFTGQQPAWLFVPPTLVRMEVTLDGATGGDGTARSEVARSGRGGPGGRVTFTLVIGHGIRARDRLELWVGGDGKWIAHHGPLVGGAGGAGGGGRGGDGTGIFDATSGQWLAIAAGGGGGGAIGGGGWDSGGDGGRSNQAGQSTPFATGGALRHPCPAQGPGESPLAGGPGEGAERWPYGAGGGGGGGCAAGAGGRRGQGAGGTGGAGGRDWTFPRAFSVSHGTAPLGDGRIVVRTVTYQEPPPEITSPARVDVDEGAPAFFDVTTIGKPPPEMTAVGAFPEGMTFRVGLFEGVGRLRGTPAAGSAGTYPVTIRIRNDWGATDQRLLIVVHPRP